MPYLKGDVEESPRHEIFYFDAGGNLNALRYDNWKIHFSIMEGAINTAYRKTPSWPILINLRADPYEVSFESSMYIPLDGRQYVDFCSSAGVCWPIFRNIYKSFLQLQVVH